MKPTKTQPALWEKAFFRGTVAVWAVATAGDLLQIWTILWPILFAGAMWSIVWIFLEYCWKHANEDHEDNGEWW